MFRNTHMLMAHDALISVRLSINLFWTTWLWCSYRMHVITRMTWRLQLAWTLVILLAGYVWQSTEGTQVLECHMMKKAVSGFIFDAC